MKSFVVLHEEVMRILATAVLTSFPELDPDVTHFELMMMRKKRDKLAAESLLVVTVNDGPNEPKPVKKSIWDRIRDMSLKPLESMGSWFI